MFNFVIQIGQIVTENQFKLRESMKVMGLRVSNIQKSLFFDRNTKIQVYFRVS